MLGQILTLFGQLLLLAAYLLFAVFVLGLVAAPFVGIWYAFGPTVAFIALGLGALIALPGLPVAAIDPDTPGSFWQRARRRRHRSDS
ncbi:hypothetical protein [Ectothiorhodospira mobilis]|uniref:hypothetical protein n=1 Tax=Ectothiorhodospira mobilis TaxID=195064 RepID=UPI0019068E30|nr:hypothetical protein [Ectothiorhodospira mobilis]